MTKIPKTKKYNFGTNSSFELNVENFETCPYYSGALISDVDVKPSPKWIQNYLKVIGIIPKNNIVDITNFVMHELGQPLHAFDLSKIEDKIIVKIYLIIQFLQLLTEKKENYLGKI